MVRYWQLWPYCIPDYDMTQFTVMQLHQQQQQCCGAVDRTSPVVAPARQFIIMWREQLASQQQQSSTATAAADVVSDMLIDTSWSCHCSDNAVDIIPWPCCHHDTMTVVTGGVITGHWYHHVISDCHNIVTILMIHGIDSFSPSAKHRSDPVIKDTPVFTS